MFGVGFSEIIFTAVLAIVVLGPDKLPKVGKMIGQVIRQYRNLKDDLTSQINKSIVIPPPVSQKKSPDTETMVKKPEEPSA